MGECMKFNTNEMMLIAMFVALMAVGAYMRIDTPLVPVTLQFAVCAYAGVLLGAKKAVVSQVAYVLIGLIGFPVFTRGGGLFYIVEPTFGYLIGFVIAAYVIGRLTESMEDVNTSHSIFRVAFAVSTGLVIVYGCGALYLSLIMNTLMKDIRKAIRKGYFNDFTNDFLKRYYSRQEQKELSSHIKHKYKDTEQPKRTPYLLPHKK